jgi:hypothetical protein
MLAVTRMAVVRCRPVASGEGGIAAQREGGR